MKCDKCQRNFASRSTLFRHMRKNCPFRELNGDVRNKKIKLCNTQRTINNETEPSVGLNNFSDVESLSRNSNSNILPPSVTGLKTSIVSADQIFLGCSNAVQKLQHNILNDLGNGIQKLQHAFRNRISSYRFCSKTKHVSPTEFLEDIKENVFGILSKYIRQHQCVKINVVLFGLYVIPEKDLSDIKSFNTKNKILTITTELQEIYSQFKEEILSKADDFQERDSGWAIQQVMFLELNINKFNPLHASSYIKLPKQIESKKAVLNIKNSDNNCFAWSINAAIFPANGQPTRTSSYPHFNTLLNFEGIEFPVKLKDIPNFEQMNNISVNVFGLDTKLNDGQTVIDVVGPLYFTSYRQATHVNLLLISDNDGNNHYCLIKDLSRLVSHQKSNHLGRVYICDGCLQFFRTSEKLLAHEEYDCGHLRTVLPKSDLVLNKYGESLPGNILKFINFEKQLQVPFVIYADFESLLKPLHHCEPSNLNSFTLKAYEHEPYAFGFYVKCNFNDDYSTYVHYRGSDAAEIFTKKLDETVLNLYNNHLKHVKDMLPLTDQQETEYGNAIYCHICEKTFSSTDKKVRDHCHLTGCFRGAAHSICNLNYKTPKFIPVFFHNLTNYDCHLFIKKLALNKETVSVIGQTKEKYISFSKSVLVEKSATPKVSNTYLRLRFVDSFRFLSASIDKLSQTLQPNQCNEIRRYFKDEKQFSLIRCKGVFPYTYVDSFAKLDENALPSKENFFNDLTSEPLSNEDYERANTVWQTFNCSTLGDYSDIYLKSDVLLLADIFENFRLVCLEKFKLDPAQYLTAPSLSWDAMLRFTHVELQLITDIDMLHFFRKGIRGGVSQCIKRKAEANNKFLPNYDSSKPSSFILYLDATNLYGYSMSQVLPVGDFRWLEDSEVEYFDCLLIDENSSKGYVLEVDLEYPPSLHQWQNALPMCPESVVPPNGKHSKLIPNLYNKSKYIIHYINLKQCLKYGLKIQKIHRVLEFSQSAWLKPYIDLNTNLRNSSKSPFERDLFKFIINSIFGKTMENVDKQKDIKFSTHWENIKKSIGAGTLISLPHFKSCAIFDENCVAIELAKLQVCYDKPLYVGFSILDISKTVIYDFYYGYIKEKYGENAFLCYTDTDSLILEIFTDNVYNDIKENIQYFDTSNYDCNNIYHIPKTISVVGKMKDEYAGTPIQSFYGTGAKAYCVKAVNVMKKAKGISKNVVKKQLHFSDYVQIVENGGSIFRKMYVFTSYLHTIYTELKNKIALSSEDDKRYLIPGTTDTLAWGHYLITDPTLGMNADQNLETSEAENLNKTISN